MIKITHLNLTNFKSFRELDFELKPLNILIGRNGAGKSNLISFFRLLCRAAEGQLADTIRSLGGLSEIRWRGSNEFVSWKLTLEGLTKSEKIAHHSVRMAPRGNSFAVVLEEVSGNPKPSHKTGYIFTGAYDGYIKYRSSKSGVEENEIEYDYNDQELVIAQIRDPIGSPLEEEIRQVLSDGTIFRGFGESALTNIYNAQSLDVVSPLRLDAEGKNLVSVLYTLRDDSRYSKAYEELLEILGEAFDDFRKLNFPLVASSKAELQWQEKKDWKPFPASQVSDGMLRFLGLATLLLLPEPPAFIAIDEPEVGLHPELIPLLAGLLKLASSRTQLIVTTHSPQLLNSQDIRPEDVVVVERVDGETRLERLDEDQLHLWLDRYTLGSLWTMGKLEHQ